MSPALHPAAPPRLFVLGSFVQATCVQVARLPERGESLLATGLHQGPGGKGFNLAVAAQRLGAEVDVLIAVGEDAIANLAADALHHEGLSSHGLLRLAGERTGQGVGFIAPDGDNAIAVYPGANAALSATHVAAQAERIAQAQLVCAQFEIGDAPIVEAFRLARAEGIRTLLNPSPWRPLSAELAGLVDVLVLNACEAAAWLGVDAVQLESPHDAADLLTSLSEPLPSLIVITLGAQGCVARERGGSVRTRAAYPVEAIDSTGAGDAFTAALAVALASGDVLADALDQASASGALSCTQLGVLEALPHREVLSDWMDNAASNSTRRAG